MATVATHEIGHQLGSEHTFNGDQGNCSGGNRSPTLAFEPGAGNTIMSYDSRCAPDNVGAGINYFHAGSLSAIVPGLNCGSSTATGNLPPSVTVPPSNTYTIPVGTPFTLAGSGTDPDGDALTYSWEELDLGDATRPGRGRHRCIGPAAVSQLCARGQPGPHVSKPGIAAGQYGFAGRNLPESPARSTSASPRAIITAAWRAPT